MSEIITTITSKPEWETKINNTTIVNKWKEELQQQGISETILNKVIQLLKKSTESNIVQVEGKDYSQYKWHLEIGCKPDIWTGCQDCECMICSEEEDLPDRLEDALEYDSEEEQEIRQQLTSSTLRCIVM